MCELPQGLGDKAFYFCQIALVFTPFFLLAYSVLRKSFLVVTCPL